MKKIIGIASIGMLLDQIVKWAILSYMTIGASISIFPFFSLTYVQNIGAAFSMLEGKQIFLIIGAIMLCFFLYFFWIRKRNLSKIEIFSYGCIYGGMLGNVIDRIIHGAVIDFLDFHIFGYSFPIFNIADTEVVIGCFLLLYYLWKEERHENHCR